MGKLQKRKNKSPGLKEVVEHNNLMKANHFIANKWITALILILGDAVALIVTNYVFNVSVKLFSGLRKNPGSMNLFKKINYGFLKNMDVHRWMSNDVYFVLFIIVCIVLVCVNIKYVYLIQTSYKDFNKEQKGGGRFSTVDEIQKQYKVIPLKEKSVTTTFPGKGGVPVCHYKNKVYIDDGPVNNLFIGMTRSGKGEMFVFQMIDIYSRAQEQASMIINDPKLELAAASYDTLTKRGYVVRVFNLIELNNSMGFNPLSLIVEAAKVGDYETAEMLCSTLCYSIFNAEDSDNGENKFFYDNATFLLSALILAHTEDCLNEDKKLNKEKKAEHEKKQKAFLELSGEEKLRVEQSLRKERELRRKIKEKLPVEEVLKINQELNDLQQVSEQYTDIEFVPTTENEKKVNMYSVINTFTELSRIQVDEAVTYLDYYFNCRPELNRAKLLYSSIEAAGGQKVKGSIFSTMLSKLMIFTYESVAKLTAESTINFEELGFGDKPVALFIGLPDYDHSKDFLASVLIRQSYFVNAKKATLTPGGKCKRLIVNIMDEFGNMPAIEGMASIVTVCLGRNIRFNLFIQSYSQLESRYGKDGATIEENCGNQVYILTNSHDTAEKFSKLLTPKTITTINRMGQKMSLNKNFTELLEEKPLLSANELLELKEGECVIKRAIKRTDLKGFDVTPRSIFNHEETRFPYRYQYMLDYFPSTNTVAEITKETRSHIVPGERIFSVSEWIQKLENSAGEDSDESPKNDFEIKKRWELINQYPLSELKEEYFYGFYKKHQEVFKTSWEEFLVCTAEQINTFLSINLRTKCAEWKQILTSVSIRYMLKNESAAKNIQEVSFEEQTKEVLVSQMENCDEIVEFITNNVSIERLEQNGLLDEIELYNLTIEEAYDLAGENRHYLKSIIDKGQDGEVYDF